MVTGRRCGVSTPTSGTGGGWYLLRSSHPISTSAQQPSSAPVPRALITCLFLVSGFPPHHDPRRGLGHSGLIRIAGALGRDERRAGSTWGFSFRFALGLPLGFLG